MRMPFVVLFKINLSFLLDPLVKKGRLLMSNKNLTHARKAKRDEFYTQKWDIEQELTRYRKSLTGKAIYCNCDDPINSRFWKYFYRQFGFLQLKQLIATHYNMDGSPSYALIYRGGSDAAPNFDENVEKIQLKGNGDFRSDECVEFLKQSDVVVTNPPFSLFREFVNQLMTYHKEFVIWGNQNAITYKEIFPLMINYLGLKSEVCSCNRLSLKHNLINSVQTCKSTPECNRIIGQLIDARLKFQTCWNLVSFRSVLDKLRLLFTVQVFST